MQMEIETSGSTPATSVSPSPTLEEKPRSYIFQAKVAQKVPEVVSGKGNKIQVKDPYTHEVKELIDGMTGAAVGALGWGDEDIIKIIDDAAKACTYSFPLTIGNQYAEELAKFYCDHSPPGVFEAALWTSSGSEANETAMKIIKQYWVEKGKPKKNKFLSRFSSYHGYTLGSLSIGNSSRSIPFNDILLPQSQCVKLPEFYPYQYQREDETLEDYAIRVLKEYEEIILREDPETIASITIETVSGSSLGTCPPTPTYLYGVKKLCVKYDIIFHLDEVMCGTGRISPNGGLNCWEAYLPLNEGPDIQSVGKTLGSGYVTIAGLLIGPKIRQAYLEGSGSIVGAQTYSCHGFNCYVALKIQQKIINEGLTKNIFEVGNYFGAQMSEKTKQFKSVGQVRGSGGFWSVEFVKDKTTKEIFDPKLDVCHLVSNKAFENGLVCMGCAGNVRGKGGDFVMFAPAFTLTKAYADEMVSIMVKSIGEVEAGLVAAGEL